MNTTHRGATTAVLVSLALFPAGCGPAAFAASSSPTTLVSPLVDGKPQPASLPLSESQVRALGRIETAAGAKRCTATLVGPRHILSAAHCFPAERGSEPYGPGRLPEVLQFHPGGTAAPVPILQVFLHPSLDLAVATTGASFSEAASVEPIALRSAAAPVLMPGQAVEAAGAGVGTPSMDMVSFGVFNLVRVTPQELEMLSADGSGLCRGDSGGPVFASGETAVTAVHVRGYDNCRGSSFSIPVDHAWVDPLLSAPVEDSLPCTAGEAGVCRDNDGWNCVNGWWRDTPCTRLRGYQCSTIPNTPQVDCFPVPCGDLSPTGTCTSGVAASCQFGARVEEDCSALGMACGLDRAAGRMACLACNLTDGGCGSTGLDASTGADASPATNPDAATPPSGCTDSGIPAMPLASLLGMAWLFRRHRYPRASW